VWEKHRARITAVGESGIGFKRPVAMFNSASVSSPMRQSAKIQAPDNSVVTKKVEFCAKSKGQFKFLGKSTRLAGCWCSRSRIACIDAATGDVRPLIDRRSKADERR